MTASQILSELESLGSESYKRTMMKNHGVREPFSGVKIADLQGIRKREKVNHPLALELYETGHYDAMYLAGLIADDARMTREDLQRWVDGAYGGALPGFTVPWVSAGSPHGWEAGLEWIGSERPTVALAGWSTLACLARMKPDGELDLDAWGVLLDRVVATIHGASDLVRYGMNGFLIATGCGISGLTGRVLRVAGEIGPLTADLGNNRCQVPSAADSIRKVQAKGGIGKKQKNLKC